MVCNSCRPSLLAKIPDNLCQFLLRKMVYQIGGSFTRGVIHAHVQGSILLKTESARTLVKLEGRHTEIHQKAIYAGNPQLHKFFGHVRKIAMKKPYSGTIRSKIAGRSLQRIRIPVKSYQNAVRS